MDLATTADLVEISDAWRRWEQEPSGFFLIPHTEILAWR